MARTFVACKQRVHNRGTPPQDFLNQLVNWGAAAAEEIFVRNERVDIYSFVKPELGPWANDRERRAAMLEVLRVLAGFESHGTGTRAATSPTRTRINRAPKRPVFCRCRAIRWTSTPA